MNKDLDDIPEWDDNLDERDEDDEERKSNVTRVACKALYQQWGTIITMIKGGLHTDSEETHQANILGGILLQGYLKKLYLQNAST
jgi:hypothetical protein